MIIVLFPLLFITMSSKFWAELSNDYEKLFETEPDAKEVIKKREIYQVMEIVTDKCEDAANVIESIIIKYA